MAEPSFDMNLAHRWFGVECNNQGWGLLENQDRRDEQTDELIHLAHAACWHWLQVGKPLNHVRALILVGRAHAAAGDGAVAVRYARNCLNLAKLHAGDLTDFDWACVYECMARSLAALGQDEEARAFHRQASEAGEAIAEADDRAVFQDGFSAGE